MRISILFCALLSSLLVTLPVYSAPAVVEKVEKDTVPLFCGAAVSVDLAGAALVHLSDYGQYEAALRINLKDKYFPIFELGYGIGKHKEDAVTGVNAEAKAAYGRVGCDFNIKKDKHDGYRLYAGFRYGFTKFDFKAGNAVITDPVYGGNDNMSITQPIKYHWIEGVFGTDAKIYGPVRLGWSVRYRRHLYSTSNPYGSAWYVPGYGKDSKVNWNGTFNLIFEL